MNPFLPFKKKYYPLLFLIARIFPLLCNSPVLFFLFPIRSTSFGICACVIDEVCSALTESPLGFAFDRHSERRPRAHTPAMASVDGAPAVPDKDGASPGASASPSGSKDAKQGSLLASLRLQSLDELLVGAVLKAGPTGTSGQASMPRPGEYRPTD